MRLDLPKSAKVKVGRAVSSGFCCIVALRLHEKGASGVSLFPEQTIGWCFAT